MRTTITTVSTVIARTAAVLVLAVTGCDEPIEQGDADDAGDVDIDGGFWGDAVRGDEEPAAVDAPAVARLASGEADESLSSVVFFRLESKQVRNATNEKLCFEPLDNVAGAPVLQIACNNSPLSNNNEQAWFQTTTLGHRIQYALKDRRSGNDLCLHLAGGVKAISDGVAAVLFQCDGTRSNQLMYASPPDATGAIALMASHSHRCLTVFGGVDSDQALLYQFGLYTGAASCGGIHQRWYLRTEQGLYNWSLVAPEGWAAPPCVL
jgi:hypothetical protein